MPLDNQLSDLPTSESKKSQEPTLIELFADSALYELHQSVYGLAQAAGLESHIGQREEPVEQSGRIDRLAQILGRGVGSFLPTAAVAVGTRFGLGRVLEHAGSAESLLLKRSVIGLSIAESAATGAITGSLLKPSGEASPPVAKLCCRPSARRTIRSAFVQRHDLSQSWLEPVCRQ